VNSKDLEKEIESIEMGLAICRLEHKLKVKSQRDVLDWMRHVKGKLQELINKLEEEDRGR